MNINAIFHCYKTNFPKAKELGFSHVEISLEQYGWDFDKMIGAFNEAHSLQLHSIVNLKDMKYEFFNGYTKCPECVLLWDDANLDEKEPISSIKEKLAYLKKETSMKTMITISYIRSFRGFENVADLAAPYIYSPHSDIWRRWKHTLKLKCFMRKSKSKLIALCPIGLEMKLVDKKRIPHVWSNDVIEMWKKFDWWMGFKPEGWAWYSWSGDGGSRNFSNLLERPDLMRVIKEQNEK